MQLNVAQQVAIVNLYNAVSAHIQTTPDLAGYINELRACGVELQEIEISLGVLPADPAPAPSTDEAFLRALRIAPELKLESTPEAAPAAEPPQLVQEAPAIPLPPIVRPETVTCSLPRAISRWILENFTR